MKVVSVADLSRQAPWSDVQFVDVRTPAEYRSGHIEGAVNVPLDKVRTVSIGEIAAGKKGVVWVCRSGSRARQACEILAQREGSEDLVVLDGGTEAWMQAGLPIEGSGTHVISLDRQVRIIAGALVVIGCLLAFSNSAWLWVPVLIGSGLLFSGITDTCGLAILLGRCPWNRK